MKEYWLIYDISAGQVRYRISASSKDAAQEYADLLFTNLGGRITVEEIVTEGVDNAPHTRAQ